MHSLTICYPEAFPECMYAIQSSEDICSSSVHTPQCLLAEMKWTMLCSRSSYTDYKAFPCYK